MKLHCALTPVLVALSLALAGCGKSDAEKAAESQAAVQQFKTDIAGIADNQPKSKGRMDREITKLKALAELPARLKAINADKLPTDLKLAHQDFITKLAKVEPLLAELGPTLTDRIRNFSANPKLGQDFAAKLQAILPEIQASGKNLIEIGKKHGIEKLSELVPQA